MADAAFSCGSRDATLVTPIHTGCAMHCPPLLRLTNKSPNDATRGAPRLKLSQKSPTQSCFTRGASSDAASKRKSTLACVFFLSGTLFFCDALATGVHWNRQKRYAQRIQCGADWRHHNGAGRLQVAPPPAQPSRPPPPVRPSQCPAHSTEPRPTQAKLPFVTEAK